MNCKNCKARCYWAGQDVAEPDHGNCYVGYVPKTNADRVRAMTDEELTEFLFVVTGGNGSSGSCVPGCYDCRKYNNDCKGAWLDWLKREAEGGN